MENTFTLIKDKDKLRVYKIENTGNTIMVEIESLRWQDTQSITLSPEESQNLIKFIQQQLNEKHEIINIF